MNQYVSDIQKKCNDSRLFWKMVEHSAKIKNMSNNTLIKIATMPVGVCCSSSKSNLVISKIYIRLTKIEIDTHIT